MVCGAALRCFQHVAPTMQLLLKSPPRWTEDAVEVLSQLVPMLETDPRGSLVRSSYDQMMEREIHTVCGVSLVLCLRVFACSYSGVVPCAPDLCVCVAQVRCARMSAIRYVFAICVSVTHLLQGLLC